MRRNLIVVVFTIVLLTLISCTSQSIIVTVDGSSVRVNGEKAQIESNIDEGCVPYSPPNVGIRPRLPSIDDGYADNYEYISHVLIDHIHSLNDHMNKYIIAADKAYQDHIVTCK